MLFFFLFFCFFFQEQKSKGVITASAGNHALALAFHGQNLNIPVTVVMPTIAPIMKIQACKTYGAIIQIQGDNICEVTYSRKQQSVNPF